MMSPDTTLPNNLEVIRKGLLEFMGLEDSVISMILLDTMPTGKSFSLDRTLGIDGFQRLEKLGAERRSWSLHDRKRWHRRDIDYTSVLALECVEVDRGHSTRTDQ